MQQYQIGQFHIADIRRHKIHACIMNRKALIVYESQVLGTYYKFHSMLTGTH